MTARWNLRSACVLAVLAVVLVTLPASAGRLFATTPGPDNLILELDPITGDILNTIASPAQHSLDGLAFDGTSLWFIGATPNTLYQINPDNGEIVKTFELPPVLDDPDSIDSGIRSGLAYLNGELYITNSDLQVQDIEVFDPVLGEVVRVLDIDGANPGSRRFFNTGLAALTDPDLLVFNTALTQELYFVDPITGVIVDTFHHNQYGVLGIAIIDNEMYLGSDQEGHDFDGVEDIHVYSRDGVQLRTFNLLETNGISSLAGGNSVPEPGSIALVTLGALALWHRRRRA